MTPNINIFILVYLTKFIKKHKRNKNSSKDQSNMPQAIIKFNKETYRNNQRLRRIFKTLICIKIFIF